MPGHRLHENVPRHRLQLLGEAGIETYFLMLN